MPKRTDINKILIIGSGPIVIGQACEFDYSGTQACRALKSEGYEIVLVNSNPATIMTDPDVADKTYIEPINVDIIEKIIVKEKPDAVLPTLGGQTALNVAMKLSEKGILKKYNLELLGANIESIEKAEDRLMFKETMKKLGLYVPESTVVNHISDGLDFADKIGYPLIIRPAFTLGGTGGGIAYNKDDFRKICTDGLDASPIKEVLIERSIIGWKEFELEVIRDKKDNFVVICTIENFDPMGVHTGDSITVAPSQTLTDKEYQRLRDYARLIICEIGVETGGSNIQFAVNPENGDVAVIEMNPRVSRSSALASKATGFPIAKIAAKLAVGYTLDELKNDITQTTPASFEPTIDYVVTKMPRWAFEKYSPDNNLLDTQMRSVGEAMAIGRTFKESFQKCIRSLEIGRYGFGFDDTDTTNIDNDKLIYNLANPNSLRLFSIFTAFKNGFNIHKIHSITKIDKWFLSQLKEIFDFGQELSKLDFSSDENILIEKIKIAKQMGFSDIQLSSILNVDIKNIIYFRAKNKIFPVFKAVDTCAAEFEAYTPYFYSSYELENDLIYDNKKKIIIIGSGPNRIGQGIEFDYCCVKATMAVRKLGYTSIMINCNPETVSTDYDVSDRLFFEPLTNEDVSFILEQEKPDGIILQLGGQTPLKLSQHLKQLPYKIIGTHPDDINRAEDREKFAEIIKKLNLMQPPNGTAKTKEDALKIADNIGFPVLIRPSYVLGGRGMIIINDRNDFENYITNAIKIEPEYPVLIDKFLDNTIEIDVDALSDGEDTIVTGIMEHIEEAGIHSGDSACVIPPISLGDEIEDRIIEITGKLAKELNVVGLINIQYAYKNNDIYVLEVNPRASRTIPYVSKATGIPWIDYAVKVMLGDKLKDLNIKRKKYSHFAVKEAVFPFKRFGDIDILLSPEMKSTGEVMGIDKNFGLAFFKAQLAAGQILPKSGNVLISVNNFDKRNIIFIAKKIIDLGFNIFATYGTAKTLEANGVDCKRTYKYGEGRPNCVDLIMNNDVNMVVNTPFSGKSIYDEKKLRQAALIKNIPYTTTVSGARFAIHAIEEYQKSKFKVHPIQYLYNE